jgi:hypothetical protein
MPCVTLNVPFPFPAVKIKVKATAIHAMKAQTGNRDVALLLL